ncbi:hypothetical protein N8940_02310 [Sphingomonadaceae bacterium]|nr:hypothetical protein [Sphingomonadaceae bacterium]
MEYLGLLIPLAPFLMVGFIVWSKNQTKLAELQLKETASASAEQAAQYATQVSKLEDRVQTLERIVTDRGYNVAAQIEALRDERVVEQQGSGVPLNTQSGERV